MEKEFNLSNKIQEEWMEGELKPFFNIDIKDVKEFIKKLKDKMKEVNKPARYGTFEDILNKLAGGKLNGSNIG